MYNEPCDQGRRVLIVDDHDISRQFMTAALRRIAGDVRQARTASEALALTSSWLPDAILLDVRLGDVNGFDLARQIRKRWPQAVRQPRIIMLSAERPCPAWGEDIHGDCNGILAKPVSERQLHTAVAPQAQGELGPDPGFPLSHLQELFRQELGTRLRALERCLISLDLPCARAILHQLIASSGLCRQRRLERDLRALEQACGQRRLAPSLAREYFALLVSARDYLRPASAETGIGCRN